MRDPVDEYQPIGGEQNMTDDACDKNVPVSGWKPFGREPINGIYWVCGTFPEADGDVNDFGEIVGWYTGESKPFVSLVYIDFNPEDPGSMIVEPINEHETGYFDVDEYQITHYMPFNKPQHVSDMLVKEIEDYFGAQHAT